MRPNGAKRGHMGLKGSKDQLFFVLYPLSRIPCSMFSHITHYVSPSPFILLFSIAYTLSHITFSLTLISYPLSLSNNLPTSRHT